MYRVEWLQAALDDLMLVWMQADSNLRQAITAATMEIDQRLQFLPHELGESRPGGRRIFFAPPLGIYYRIDEVNRTVLVSRIWLFRVRSA